MLTPRDYSVEFLDTWKKRISITIDHHQLIFSINLPSDSHTKGPPESPRQASIPSSSVPAQNIPSLISLPYTCGCLHVSSSRMGIIPARSSLAGAIEASSSIELIIKIHLKYSNLLDTHLTCPTEWIPSQKWCSSCPQSTWRSSGVNTRVECSRNIAREPSAQSSPNHCSCACLS